MAEKVINAYRTVPRDSAADGGYAGPANRQYAQNKGMMNIVFNKVAGRMQNRVSRKNMETHLKKWHSAIASVYL
ncbi:MAG: hypothetical protein LBR86_08080 [Tannerella sp.]|jgi:hypothetical protein|nr:hypothetical protein [Tannerella sp.]